MNAPTLFDAPPTHGRARATDPETSLDAARVRRADLEHKILSAYAEHGPMTDDELCACVDKYAPTVKTARSRLARTDREGGALVEFDEVLRTSNHGRSMKVWQLTAAGRARSQHT